MLFRAVSKLPVLWIMGEILLSKEKVPFFNTLAQEWAAKLTIMKFGVKQLERCSIIRCEMCFDISNCLDMLTMDRQTREMDRIAFSNSLSNVVRRMLKIHVHYSGTMTDREPSSISKNILATAEKLSMTHSPFNLCCMWLVWWTFIKCASCNIVTQKIYYATLFCKEKLN